MLLREGNVQQLKEKYSFRSKESNHLQFLLTLKSVVVAPKLVLL